MPSFSTLSEIYSAWSEFQIPATFYHYFLTVLNDKPKIQQSILMNREISSLKLGTHMYLKIRSGIEARESSIQTIRSNLSPLKDQGNSSNSSSSLHEEKQVLGFKKLFDSKQNPEEKIKNQQLRVLANHLMIYRKITLQIIFQIHKWMNQIMSLGYEGLVQFMYNNEDYLQQITEKMLTIMKQYTLIFEFNPFFIVRKNLSQGKLAQIYNLLRITPEYANNLNVTLNLLADHHANVLKHKIVGKNSLMLKRKHQKRLSMDNFQGKLFNDQDSHMISSSRLKSEQFITKYKSNAEDLRLRRNNSELESYSYGSQKPQMLNVPPSSRRSSFLQSKYQISYNGNSQSSIQKEKRKPSIPDILLEKRQNAKIEKDNLKSLLGIRTPSKVNINTPRRIDSYRNLVQKELQLQPKTKIVNQINQLKKLKPRNSHGKQQRSDDSNLQRNSQNITERKSNGLDSIQTKSSKVSIGFPIERNLFNSTNKDHEKKELEFQVQKNIHPSDILRYLRQVFKRQIQTKDNKESQGCMSQEKIEALAKALLNIRQQITIFKIFKTNSSSENKSQRNIRKTGSDLVAWIVCKLQTDLISFEREVDIVFDHQFEKVADLQQRIINYFSELGYPCIKYNGKTVHQGEKYQLYNEGVELIRCKYKVSKLAYTNDIKEIVKTDKCLKMSRILKYHYYSITSKYHKFCEHKSQQNTCQISYRFEQVCKVFIDDKTYLKAKIESISRVKQCYKIHHHLNKHTFLILATTLEHLQAFDKDLSKKHEHDIEKDMEHDSSFEQGRKRKSFDYEFVCLEQAKVIRKFVNEKDKPVINEFAWIQNNIPDVKSIAVNTKDVVGSGCLVISKPYIIAIYGKVEKDGLKSLAVLDFSQ